MNTLYCLVVFSLLASCCAQSPGNGISKTTYACDDPVPGKTFLQKYFPVGVPQDECTNDICDCTDPDGTTWNILQGRVYALESQTAKTDGPGLQAPAGNGFGLHLVNVSESLTTGGKSTAEVEEFFAEKLTENGMSKFDSFMDFNAMFYTTELAAYKKTFEADGVAMYTCTWTYDSKDWTSIFIHVPKTQLVLELAQDTKLEGDYDHHSHPRASPHAVERALHMVQPLKDDAVTTTTGGIITPLAVNRGVSEKTMAKLEDFYVTGMGATMVVNTTGSGGGDTAFKEYKCFLWPSATVDVCFYSRDATATKGDFKVESFEDMLNTVHENIIVKNPSCNRDKWTDNHYAIDSFKADTTQITKYIDANSVPVYCEGTKAHYAIDPTGWGIQMDLGGPWATGVTPAACSSARVTSGRKLLQQGGTFNPACTTASSCPA